MENMEKKRRKQVAMIFAFCTLILASVAKEAYSFFSATVTSTNKTNTVLKAQTLSLTFRGTNEVVNCGNIVPGDKCIKTFEVENTSSVETFYNIYMENVENGFNSDLVYTLKEGQTTVVGETVAPVTKSGKSYIKSNVTIPANTTKSYTLTIEFKYNESTPQNANQGKEFRTTVGIDTVQRTYDVQANQIAATVPEGAETNCTGANATVDCMLNELHDRFNN